MSTEDIERVTLLLKQRDTLIAANATLEREKAEITVSWKQVCERGITQRDEISRLNKRIKELELK